MERGDISSWSTRRIIVVLEGVLTTPTYEKTGVVRKRDHLLDPDHWLWEDTPVRFVVDYGSRLNVAVEVVTFLGQDVADGAAEWFEKYGVTVTEVLAVDFDTFCQSLIWRINEVERVIDSDWARLQRYGQLGQAVERGGRF